MSDDQLLRIWTRIAEQSLGNPISPAHVCTAAVATVGVDGAGLSVVVGPTVRETVDTTDAVAAVLEELQLTLGQGPCVDAFTGGGPVLAEDLRSSECSTRWPAFTPAALAAGAGSVYALPLQVGAIRLGVLDLYRARPARLDPQEMADALAFADAAGILLLDGVGTRSEAVERTWQTEDTSAREAVVHQATGMILVQLGIGAEAAFARLRAYAYAHERRLSDVARDVVDRRLRFEPDPPL
jgi:ANTAR domain-containing protein/GAF domain-containing protein